MVILILIAVVFLIILIILRLSIDVARYEHKYNVNSTATKDIFFECKERYDETLRNLANNNKDLSVGEWTNRTLEDDEVDFSPNVVSYTYNPKIDTKTDTM